MYCFIEILYLVSSVIALRLNIDGDVRLGPELVRYYNIEVEVPKDKSVVADRRRLSEVLKTVSSSESSDSSSDDESNERTIVTTTKRSTTRKRKKKRISTRLTTSFTTKYERGTTTKYKIKMRADHHHRHHHRHGKNKEKAKLDVHAYTIPKWPSFQIFLESDEKPTIYPPTKTTTDNWDKTPKYNDHHHHHHHQGQGVPVTQIIDWVDQVKNKTKEIDSVFNQYVQPEKWQQTIVNETKQIGDTISQFGNEANKLQNEIINKTSLITDTYNQLGNEVGKLQKEVVNKTSQFGDQIADYANQGNKFQQDIRNETQQNIQNAIKEYDKGVQTWHEQMVNKTQQEVGGILGGLNSHINKWQKEITKPTLQVGEGNVYGDQSKQDKQKNHKHWNNKSMHFENKYTTSSVKFTHADWAEIENKSSYVSDKFKDTGVEDKFKDIGDQANKWQSYGHDKQKELQNQFQGMGNAANKWHGNIKNKSHAGFGMEDKFKDIGNEANKWQNYGQDKQKELQNQFQGVGNAAHKWHGNMKNKSYAGFGLDDKFKDIGNEANKWQNYGQDKQKELQDQFQGMGNVANKWHGDMKNKSKSAFDDKVNDYNNQANKWADQMKGKQQEFVDKTSGYINQGQNWNKHLYNKSKGFADDKYSEASHLGGKWQQQYNNYTNNIGNVANSSYHKIKDDLPISKFTKHILTRTLSLFDKVKSETNEYHWKKKVKRLAKNYERKYKEFLRTTRKQHIKTKLGMQKVVLNAIETSNQIVNRLVNMMIHEIDKKGMLRSSRTQNLFHKEIKQELDIELKQACLTLGICITHSGFTEAVTHILTNMIMLENDKFQEAIDAFTEAVKYTDFTRSLGAKNVKELHRRISIFEDRNIHVQRALVNIIKNIVANRNKPLVLDEDTDPKECNLNKTLAFLEIIDTLDKNVPDSKENIAKLYEIRSNISGWVRGDNIPYTMDRFATLINDVLDELNGKAWNTVRHNVNILFS